MVLRCYEDMFRGDGVVLTAFRAPNVSDSLLIAFAEQCQSRGLMSAKCALRCNVVHPSCIGESEFSVLSLGERTDCEQGLVMRRSQTTGSKVLLRSVESWLTS
jgi:hypothetical protein